MQQTTPGAGGGGQPQQRELVYRVRVVADTSQANQAFQQMGQAARAGAAGHYGQQAQGYNGQPMHYQPGVGWAPAPWTPGATGPNGSSGQASGGAGGALANLGLFAARLGIAVGFVTQAMEKFRGVMDAVNLQGRETVNAQAKMEKWFEAVPVVGQPVGQFMSYGASLQQRWGVNNGFGYGARAAASGRTLKVQNRLRDEFGVPELAAGVMGEFVAAEQEYTEAQDRAFMAPFDTARESATREAAARRRAIDDQYTAASESAGFRADEAREQSRLLFPGRGSRRRFDSDDQYDAVLRSAERGRVSAATTAGMAREEQFRARMERQDAAAGVTGRAAFDAAQRQVELLKERAKTDPTIQAGDIAMASAEAEKASARYAEQLADYQKALNKEKEKSVGLAQAEYELAQKSLATEQAKLSVVEAKLKQNDGYAESFAMLNGGQRQGLIDSVKQLNDGDFGSLSPRQRELLAGSGITADFFRKKAREYTLADPEARGQLDDLARLTGQQTRRELTEERNKLQAKIELQFTSNPEQLADQLRRAFKLIDPELRKLVEESLRLERAKLERQEAAARAGNK